VYKKCGFSCSDDTNDTPYIPGILYYSSTVITCSDDSECFSRGLTIERESPAATCRSQLPLNGGYLKVLNRGVVPSPKL
jgi:hypothetical protein